MAGYIPAIGALHLRRSEILGSQEPRSAMVTQQIDLLKQEYTDKYVVVDGSQPELARFRDIVGRVKTVNMSGRALVEFDDYHDNIGWYDIGLEFLKVVDKPPPKVEKPAEKKLAAEKKPAAKAEAAKSAAPAKPAAAAAPAAGGKPSVADILAAARGGKAAAAPAKSPAATKPATAAEKPAAPKPAAGGKLSTADILAAARGGEAAAPATPQAEAAPVAKAEPPAQAAADEPVAEAAPARAKSTEKVDKSKMTIDDILTWCREHDSK